MLTWSCKLLLSQPSQPFSASFIIMASQSIEDALVAAKNCSQQTSLILKERLSIYKVPELRAMSKKLSIRLTGVSRKADIVGRLASMADADDTDPELPSLSYLTNDVRKKFQSLPKFGEVDVWSKNLSGIISDFTFMNLLVYLVYRRDKTFDMESM